LHSYFWLLVLPLLISEMIPQSQLVNQCITQVIGKPELKSKLFMTWCAQIQLHWTQPSRISWSNHSLIQQLQIKSNSHTLSFPFLIIMKCGFQLSSHPTFLINVMLLAKLAISMTTLISVSRIKMLFLEPRIQAKMTWFNFGQRKFLINSLFLKLTS